MKATVNINKDLSDKWDFSSLENFIENIDCKNVPPELISRAKAITDKLEYGLKAARPPISNKELAQKLASFTD